MWLKALNLISTTNCNKVCSKHFSANDFLFSSDRNTLQSNAVPTRLRPYKIKLLENIKN